MIIGASSAFFMPQPLTERGPTRRGLLKGGLGLTGVAGLMLPGTGAYAAMEAANDLVITDYAPAPPGWPDRPSARHHRDRRHPCRRPQHGDLVVRI